jgi:hypothetical protein
MNIENVKSLSIIPRHDSDRMIGSQSLLRRGVETEDGDATVRRILEASKPGGLHPITFKRHRVLVELCGEDVGAICAQLLEHGEGLSRRVQRVPFPALMTPVGADFYEFVGRCDGRQPKFMPTPPGKEEACEVVLVQALHDEQDCSQILRFEAPPQTTVEPVDDRLASALVQVVVRLHRIVNHDVMSSATGQHAADRCREAVSSARRLKITDGLPD